LQSFDKTIDEVENGDWIFLDPPYYERNSKYEVDSDAGSSETFHIEIFDKIKDLKQPWLFVHLDCDLYRDLYKDFNIHSNDYFYTQNFKGKGIKNGSVKHLYITNY